MLGLKYYRRFVGIDVAYNHQRIAVKRLLEINKNNLEVTKEALQCARIARSPVKKLLSDILCVAKISIIDPAKREQLYASAKRVDKLFTRLQAEQTVITNSFR